MTTISIADLYNQLDHYVGKELSISGRLLISDKCFLAVSSEACIRGECLQIRDDAALLKGLSVVPPFGGGPFMYDEAAMITGIIGKGKNGYELTGTSSCVIQFQNEEIKIL